MGNIPREELDINDPANLGRPIYFNVEKYLDVIEQVIMADEVETALWMIRNLPAFYRDRVPARVVEIEKQLLRRFFLTIDYARDGEFHPLNAEESLFMLDLERAKLTREIVKKLNDEGITPHIHEVAAGNYWLTQALLAADLRFTYFGPSLNAAMQRDASEYLKDIWAESPEGRASIFIAFELIEHLTDPGEIYHHYVKSGLDADYILLSTPHGVYNGGMPDWYARDLGHLRAYTPGEFLAFAHKYWPWHKWTLFDGPVMCLQGEKK